jgi:hypothetical protein
MDFQSSQEFLAQLNQLARQVLTLCLNHQVSLGNDFLVECLERVDVVRAPLLYHVYLAERSATDYLEEVEVSFAYLGLRGQQVLCWSFFLVILVAFLEF